MYCSNCGEKRNDTGGFCSHCGKQQNGSTSNRKESSSFTHSFSSKLILGGNLLRPDRLVLDQDGVTYIKRNSYLIRVDESFLAYDSISYVKIDRGIINSTIIISSRGSQGIRAANFSLSDAQKIEKIIKNNI